MDKNNFKTVWLLLYTNIMLMMLCAHKHSHASLQILIIFHKILWACINILNKGVISVLLHLNYWWTYYDNYLDNFIIIRIYAHNLFYSTIHFSFNAFTYLHTRKCINYSHAASLHQIKAIIANRKNKFECVIIVTSHWVVGYLNFSIRVFLHHNASAAISIVLRGYTQNRKSIRCN